MRIAAITKFKHGTLYQILKRLGWTQSELARRSGICPTTLGQIINLLRRPTQKYADAIQRALGEAGEYLDVTQEWPEVFQGFKKQPRIEQIADIEIDRLIDHPEVLQIAAPDNSDANELAEVLCDELGKLNERQRAVLDDCVFNGKTLEKTGIKFGVTRERVRQIKIHALTKIRNSERVQEILQP